KAPGPVMNTAVLTTDFGLRVEDSARMEILATPAALRLEVIDIGDPVEVGKQVEYQIEVANTGSKPAGGVQVIATLPAELKAVNTVGGPANVQGQTITFGKLEALAPGQTQKYSIKAEALKAGDVRFEAKLLSDILTSPVTETESTTVVDPAGVVKG